MGYSTYLDQFKQHQNNVKGATDYVSLVGKASVSATAKHTGSLHSLTVKSKIHYQPSDGMRNYHECPAFDDALAVIIQQRWKELAPAALHLMGQIASQSARLAQDDLNRLQTQLNTALRTAD